MKQRHLIGGLMAGLGTAALALGAPGIASAQQGGTTTYTANLQPVPLNTPPGAASGSFTLVLRGRRATVHETVSGLADKIPTNAAVLKAVHIPQKFAGAPFPHVQHIHIDGHDSCPTAASDTNHDGVISTAEGMAAYGHIGTTLSVKGSTAASQGTNILIAPGGGSFTYNRTFTLGPATLRAIKNNDAVIVVHGLNPATAPKASVTTPNSLGLVLPGETQPVALLATAPALCGVLTASQMTQVPSDAPQTGGGSTAGFQDLGLLAAGGALMFGGSGMLFFRRKRMA